MTLAATPETGTGPGTGPVAEEVCGALSVVLRHGVDIHRCLAAQALGRIGHERAVEPLIESLLDEDEDVRTDVAGALLRMADPSDTRAAGQLMENLLGDPCTDVKLAAIDALVRFKEADVVPWLRKLIKGRDEGIQWDESEFYENGWDDWLDIQIKAIEGLAEFEVVEAIPDMIEAMEDEHGQELSGFVFKALARLGNPGIKALTPFLSDADERRRRRAVTALSAIKGEKVEALLTNTLNDTAATVRLAALRALAERHPSGINLASALEDKSSEVRAEAVCLIGSAHPERFSDLLDDQSLDVQKAVMGLLIERPELGDGDGDGDGEELLPRLRAKLDSLDPHLASLAAMALAKIAPNESLDGLIALLADSRRPEEARLGALRALAGIDNELAVSAVLDVITDKERSLRIEAMASLSALARSNEQWPNPAADALLRALGGELLADEGDLPEPNEPPDAAEAADDEDREKAVDDDGAFPTSTLDAIAGDYAPKADVLKLPAEGVELTPLDMERLALAKRIKGKKCLPVVPKVAPHQDIRRFAARVLGDLSHRNVAVALAEALSEDDTDLRRAAADSLARFAVRTELLPASAIEALLALVNDSDRTLRLSVVRALGASSDKGVVDVLTCCLKDQDSFVRTEAIHALSGLGEAGSKIVALLDDPDPGVRLAAAQAVARAGRNGAVKELVDFAFTAEGYHRREAGRLLRTLDTPLANAGFLEALADDARKRTWPVAIEALEELNLHQGSGKAPELERNIL